MRIWIREDTKKPPIKYRPGQCAHHPVDLILQRYPKAAKAAPEINTGLGKYPL